MLEDSMRDVIVRSMQSLSPSVGPSGNGRRNDSSAFCPCLEEKMLDDAVIGPTNY